MSFFNFTNSSLLERKKNKQTFRFVQLTVSQYWIHCIEAFNNLQWHSKRTTAAATEGFWSSMCLACSLKAEQEVMGWWSELVDKWALLLASSILPTRVQQVDLASCWSMASSALGVFKYRERVLEGQSRPHQSWGLTASSNVKTALAFPVLF